jgi:hypothetical protein
MRAVAHRLNQQSNEASAELRVKFEGKIAYLSMLNPAQAAPFKSDGSVGPGAAAP